MLRNDTAPTLSLDGVWDFSLGQEHGSIRVPGCWEAQGYSKWVDGPARYRRHFTIPDAWSGLHIFVEFEAVSYACTVSMNGASVAQHRGMWTPFAVDLTGLVEPGRENTLELEIYKPGEKYPLRSSLAGFLPDVATPFGGIWQSVRLRALAAGLDDLLIDTNPDNGQIRLRCRPSLFGQGQADTPVCAGQVRSRQARE